MPAFLTLFGDSRKTDNEDAKEMQRASLRGDQMKGVVDPTGCGNTFCGGFIAGWYKTRNLLTAALWGSISASFSKFHLFLTILACCTCAYDLMSQAIPTLSTQRAAIDSQNVLELWNSDYINVHMPSLCQSHPCTVHSTCHRQQLFHLDLRSNDFVNGHAPLSFQIV